MIKDCQGLGKPCKGEGFYRIFYKPGYTTFGAGWFCYSCVQTLKFMGATVIDKKHGL